MARETTVIARVQVEGLHCWPGAFADVTFLRYPHRHIFHIEARAAVQHADRQIEIIDLGHQLRAWLREQYGEPADFGTLSCEMIADKLMDAFDLQMCTVLEDGENGAMVREWAS